MDLKKLRELVDHLIVAQSMGAGEKFITERLVEFLYHSKGRDLMTYFLLIDKFDKERIEEENNILYRGLEDAMHNLSWLSRPLEEEKQPLRRIKEYNEYIFESPDGNIASMVRIALAYFPNGTSDGASNNGKYFFKKFVDQLIKHKEKYLDENYPNNSVEWAKDYGYYDYIKTVLEKHSNGEQEQKEQTQENNS